MRTLLKPYQTQINIVNDVDTVNPEYLLGTTGLNRPESTLNRVYYLRIEILLDIDIFHKHRKILMNENQKKFNWCLVKKKKKQDLNRDFDESLKDSIRCPTYKKSQSRKDITYLINSNIDADGCIKEMYLNI